MALLGETADHQLAGVEIIFEIGHESAPGHIGVGAFPGYVLADPVDDQGKPLADGSESVIDERLQVLFGQLEQAGLPAGSERAQRVFA